MNLEGRLPSAALWIDNFAVGIFMKNHLHVLAKEAPANHVVHLKGLEVNRAVGLVENYVRSQCGLRLRRGSGVGKLPMDLFPLVTAAIFIFVLVEVAGSRPFRCRDGGSNRSHPGSGI